MKKIKKLKFIKEAMELFEENEKRIEADKKLARESMQDLSTNDYTLANRKLSKSEQLRFERELKHNLAEMNRKKYE